MAKKTSKVMQEAKKIKKGSGKKIDRPVRGIAPGMKQTVSAVEMRKLRLAHPTKSDAELRKMARKK